jgi:hypothetical protein
MLWQVCVMMWQWSKMSVYDGVIWLTYTCVQPFENIVNSAAILFKGTSLPFWGCHYVMTLCPICRWHLMTMKVHCRNSELKNASIKYDPIKARKFWSAYNGVYGTFWPYCMWVWSRDWVQILNISTLIIISKAINNVWNVTSEKWPK